MDYKIFTLANLFLIALLVGCSDEDLHAKSTIKTSGQHIESVHKIASLIEKYKANTGKYPFHENWLSVKEGYVAVPISVKLTNKRLPEEFRYPPPGRSGLVISQLEFEEYLSRGLKEKIVLPMDDREIRQKNGNWPFFYQFLYDGQDYYVSCFLTESHPKARKIDDGWYKYEVGSTAVAIRNILLFDANTNTGT